METTAHGTTFPSLGTLNHAESSVNKASASAHGAVNAMAGKADEIANKAKPAIDRVAALAHQAVDKAAGAAAPTADWLSEQGESLKGAQKKLIENTSSYVSSHPVKAVGFALAAGFLLSRLFR